MIANNVFMVLNVSTSYSLIRMHAQIDPTLILGLLIGGIDTAGFLILSYMKLGEVNQRSREFLASWQRKSGYLKPDLKLRMKKLIRSSRPLRVELNQFGYYNKPASIRIVGKLVTYVVKFLMLTYRFEQ